MNKGFSNWKDATMAFRNHEKTSCHHEAVEMIITLPAMTTHIGKQLSRQYGNEMAKNRKVLLRILSSIRYLAKQGLPFRGDEGNGNFHQLLMLLSKEDSTLSQWLEKKAYFS